MITPRRILPGAPQDVAAGDGLRGLAQPHVVGQEQAARHEKSLDSVALIGIKRPLQGFERSANLSQAQSPLDQRLEPLVLAVRASTVAPGRARSIAADPPRAA